MEFQSKALAWCVLTKRTYQLQRELGTSQPASSFPPFCPVSSPIPNSLTPETNVTETPPTPCPRKNQCAVAVQSSLPPSHPPSSCTVPSTPHAPAEAPSRPEASHRVIALGWAVREGAVPPCARLCSKPNSAALAYGQAFRTCPFTHCSGSEAWEYGPSLAHGLQPGLRRVLLLIPTSLSKP